MSLDFEKYAAKGNAIINRLSEDAGVKADTAGRILRATLHGLRNRLSTNDSFHMLAQLPMALKGVYVDGWNPDKPYERMKLVKDFLDDVRKEDGPTAAYDFGNDEKMKKLIGSVFRTLHYHISDGEMKNILSNLPGPLRDMINDEMQTESTTL